MGTFTDTFDRANGAPGGNWVNISNTPTIENGWLRQSTVGVAAAYNTTLSDGGRHECVCRLGLSAQASNFAGPIVKWVTASGAGYFSAVVYTSSTWYLRIFRGVWGAMSQIASTTLSAGPPTIYDSRLVWDNGTLTATITGGGSCTVEDATYANGTYMGLAVHYNLQMADWVTMITGSAPAFDVTPDVIPNYGSSTELTFTGTNTEWSAGTPGTPTFTCDHGTLSDQSVASATSATATYDPGDYLGPVVFTDPSTGLTDTCVVSSDIGVIPPGYLPLSQTAIDYIERSAIAETNPTIANREMNIASSGPSITLTSGMNTIRLSVSDATITGYEVPDETTLVQILMELWRGLNGTLIFGGSTYVPDNVGSVKEDTDTIRTSLAALRAPIDWTLAGILNVIVGDDSISTTHLHDDIAAISAGSNQDVLDALAAYFGANPPTIQQLGQMVSDIATIAGYTLGDVLDEIADTQSAVASVGTTLSTVSTNVTNGFQAVLDAIAAIPTATPTAGAPVWPGQANVTFGTPVALSNGMTIDEEMDGVIVTVTTPPTLTGRYVIGSETYDYGVGRIAFESDGGEVEPWQYLGFRAALFTPKSMLRASAVHLQVLAGAQGTVTPWVVS